MVAIAMLPSMLTAQTTPNKTFTPGQIFPDMDGVHINAHGAGILFHKGKYYMFGEHKTDGTKGNKANVGVAVYSSKDLYNWRNNGIALSVVKDDPNHPITTGCVLERPKVIYNEKTKKFVMWFHLELKGQGYTAAQTGVAISDRPTGPYKYVRSLRPNPKTWPENYSEKQKAIKYEEGLKIHSKEGKELVKQGVLVNRDFEGGQMSRDMQLFVDDNGKAYHIAASEENQTLHIRELSDDYLSFTGRYTRNFVGRSMEAPAIFKRKNRYYLIMSGCTGWAPNAGRSAVADNIMGPWKELGNPTRGTEEEMKTTFWSQSTYILPVTGKKDAYIYLGDRWTPKNAIDGRYIWLPIIFDGDTPQIKWYDQWDLSIFK